MAYPMIKFPTFAEFIEKWRDKCGIEFKDFDGEMAQEGDQPLSIHFLEGEVNGTTVRCVVDIQDYDARVAPSVHRSICARFKLDQEQFGSDESTLPEIRAESEGT